MGQETGPPRKKNPAKVLAGQKGGFAKARYQKSRLSSSDSPSTKRKHTQAASTTTPTDRFSPFGDSITKDSQGDDDNEIFVKRHKPTLPVPKLEIQGPTAKTSEFPHLITGTEHPIPLTIQTKDGRTYRINSRFNEASNNSFWEWMSDKLAKLRAEVGDQAYGTLVDYANRELHLDVAAQLLNRAGQLRYSEANPSELVVAKKNYKGFLITLQENSTRLLASTKEDLAQMATPLETSEFTKKLLCITPRNLPMIAEHNHRSRLDGHVTILAHAAEIIRQELAGIGNVASNYAEEARKATITFLAVYECLRQMLDPKDASQSDPAASNASPSNASPSNPTASNASPSNPATSNASPSNTAASNFPPSNSTTASNPSHPIMLPDLIVAEVFKGHQCRCVGCQPNIKQQLYEEVKADLLEVKADLLRVKEMVIRREEIDNIRQELKAKCLPKLLTQVQSEIRLSLEKEMRTEKWIKEQEDLSTPLAKEMSSSLRERGKAQAHKELLEKLTAGLLETKGA